MYDYRRCQFQNCTKIFACSQSQDPPSTPSFHLPTPQDLCRWENLVLPPAGVHPPRPRSLGTALCHWFPSHCSTWTMKMPWLRTTEPSAHTSSWSKWNSTKNGEKKDWTHIHFLPIEIMEKKTSYLFFRKNTSILKLLNTLSFYCARISENLNTIF